MTSQPTLQDLYRLRWLLHDLEPGLKSWDLARIAAFGTETNPTIALEIAEELLATAEPFDDLDRELLRLVGELAARMRNDNEP